MDYKSLTRGLSVGPQVTVADLPALKQAGFRAIICNRPDGEGADQPTFEEVSRAAQDLGLKTLYLPIVAGRVSDKEAAAFGDALTTLTGPVLAFCRSLFTQPRFGRCPRLNQSRSLADIQNATKAAGYDMGGVVRRIVNGGKTSSNTGDASFEIVIVGSGEGGLRLQLSIQTISSVTNPAGPWSGTQYSRPPIPRGVHWIEGTVAAFEQGNNLIILVGCRVMKYLRLTVCPRVKLDWHKVEGLVETLGKNGVTSNYRYDLGPYTRELVRVRKAGRVIFTQPAMPIKCAGAPQKVMYLLGGSWFRCGVLKNIDIQFNTAGGVLFGVKDYVTTLMDCVRKYDATLNFFRTLVAVDGPAKKAWLDVVKPDAPADRLEMDFDMLHVCPPQAAPDFIKV
jgi:sulfide:quinone oxidoreductase